MSPEKTGSFRFGRDCRLKSDLQIRNVGRYGKRLSGRHLLIRSLVTGESDAPQFCIKTPRAIGTAVRRNRAKRIIREMLRLNIDRIQPGVQAVIVVRNLGDDRGESLRADIAEFIENA